MQKPMARICLDMDQIVRIADALSNAGEDALAVQFYSLGAMLARKEGEKRARNVRLHAREEESAIKRHLIVLQELFK